MAQYYSEGFLNIAATSGDNPSCGLFRDRTHAFNLRQPKLSTSEPLEIRVNHSDEATSLYVRLKFTDARQFFRGSIHDKEGMAPLMERAWVFQERILSRRTLHFHGKEMVYECESTLTCECDIKGRDFGSKVGLKSRLPYPDQDVGSLDSMLNYWLDIVSTYSSKDLSYESDRLPALSGLASRLSAQFGTTYLAGVWEEDLSRQLLWRSNGALKDLKRPAISHAPSWSWASLVKPSIQYDWLSGPAIGFSQKASILEAQCTPSGENSFGAVESGFITLEARAIEVEVGLHDSGFLPFDPFLRSGDQVGGLEHLNSEPSDMPNSEFDLDLKLSFDENDDLMYDGESLENKKILCVLLGLGLAFHRSEQKEFDMDVTLVVVSKGSKDAFARMGLFRISKLKSWFKDAPMRMITLIDMKEFS